MRISTVSCGGIQAKPQDMDVTDLSRRGVGVNGNFTGGVVDSKLKCSLEDAITNERKTENLVRDALRSLGYMEVDNGISVEEQKSEVVKIKRLLSRASKQMTGKPGYPEFIVSSHMDSAFAILVECKPNTSKHQSKNGNDPVHYAVDGAIHYAQCLAEKFTIVAVGVSGITKSSLKVSNYLIAAGTREVKPLVNEKGIDVNSLISFDDYYRLASFDPDVTAKRHADLLEFSKDLHEIIWTKAKISEEEKPLLVSGT